MIFHYHTNPEGEIEVRTHTVAHVGHPTRDDLAACSQKLDLIMRLGHTSRTYRIPGYPFCPGCASICNLPTDDGTFWQPEPI